MKPATYFIISSIAAVAAALLLFAHNAITSRGIILTLSIVFMLAGIGTLIYAVYGQWQSRVSRYVVGVSAVAAFVGGLLLLVYKEEVALTIPTIFGIICAAAAVWKFSIPLLQIKKSQQPWAWLFIAPAALLGVAIYLWTLPKSVESDPNAMAALAISLLIIAIASVIEGLMLRIDAANAPAASNANPAGNLPTAPSAPDKPAGTPKSGHLTPLDD